MQGSRNRGALTMRALMLFIGWVVPAASFAAVFTAADFASGSPAVAAALPSAPSEFSTPGFDVGLVVPLHPVRTDGLSAAVRSGPARFILVARAAVPAAP